MRTGWKTSLAEISCLSTEIKDEIRGMKTVEKMLQATWNAVNDLQEAKTHGDFKRTTQQTLDTHQQEINALKSKGEKSILESQQA